MLIFPPRRRHGARFGGLARFDFSRSVNQGANACVDALTSRNLIDGRASTLTGTKTKAMPQGLMRAYGATVGAGASDIMATPLGGVLTTAGATFAFAFVCNSNGGGSLGRLAHKGSGDTATGLVINVTGTSIGLAATTSSGAQCANNLWTRGTDGQVHVMVMVTAGNSDASSSTASPTSFAVLDGLPLGAGGNATFTQPSTDSSSALLNLGNRISANRNWDGLIGQFTWLGRAMSVPEAVKLCASLRQALRASIPQRLWYAPSSGVQLAAAATGQASSTADLSKSVSLAAAALGVATGTAGISLAVPLAAAAAGQASAGAALDHGVTLQASATGNASGTAGLALTIGLSAAAVGAATATVAAALGKPLTAAAAGQAGATADLSTSAGGTVNLAANAAGQASGTAALQLVINLSAAAVAAATSSADLTDAKQLAAAAIAQASASAALSVGSGLSANAQGQASAGATLWLQVPLSAAALAQASAGAGLQLQIQLGANAFGRASSSASFSTPVNLAANGQAVAGATAALSITPVFATWTSTRWADDEARDFTASDEVRDFTAEDEPA